jgi:tripartite-type tricarboxylate transporter receptor subunit TctC
MLRRSILGGVAGTAIGWGGPWRPARAEAWPARPVTMICPWPEGGGSDQLLRALATELATVIGVRVNVANVTGGGGAIGHAAILRAPPDGSTIGMITFELNSLPSLGLVPFTWRDFDPLMRLNMDAAALSVGAIEPFRTVSEFVDYARRRPGTITIGDSGPGSVWQIGAALMAESLGIRLRHVPFDGAVAAVKAAIAGKVDGVGVSLAEVHAELDLGRMRALAVMAEARVDRFPTIPTFSELGESVVFGTWRGLALPKGVPDADRERIRVALRRAFDAPGFRVIAADAGLTLAYQDGEDFARFLDDNVAAVKRALAVLGPVRR